MRVAPAVNVREVERVALHGEDVTEVVLIFWAEPAQLLDDQILGGRQPCRTGDLVEECPHPPLKTFLVMRVVAEEKQFDAKIRAQFQSIRTGKAAQVVRLSHLFVHSQIKLLNL